MRKLRANWFTKHPPRRWHLSFALLALVWGVSGLYLYDYFGLRSELAVSGEAVFAQGEWWRLFSAQLVHADLAHLMSNTLFFLLFSVLLTNTYSRFFFPLSALAMGAAINLLCVSALPQEVSLVGISGVVHWMGAAWFTLYLLIDRREPLKRRIAVILFLTLMLFLPESYRPEVSYAAHLWGYALGALAGVVYYFLRRAEFHAAEEYEEVSDEVSFDDWMVEDDRRPESNDPSSPRSALPVFED